MYGGAHPLAMVSSIATSPAVDLSRLPAPNIISQPDFEVRRGAKIARLTGLLPVFTAIVESDPAIKLIEADSYDEMILAQGFNDAARSMLLAFATGGSLDHLGALMDVARLTLTTANVQTGAAAVMEGDDDYRRRILIAPHSFSVAGPELAYVYHARSASADVVDASATSPSPGVVIVSILSRTVTGAASPATITAVDAVLNHEAVRPLTDFVTVQSADIVNFNILADLYLYFGPDAGLIMQTAMAGLTAYLTENRRLGRDITRAGIIAALKVAGVQNVILTAPAADLILTPLQCGYAANVTVNNAGNVE